MMILWICYIISSICICTHMDMLKCSTSAQAVSNRSKSSHVIPNGRNCSMGWISQTFTTPYTPRRKHEANRKMHTLLSCGLSCIPMGSSSNLDVYFILFNQCGGSKPKCIPNGHQGYRFDFTHPPQKDIDCFGKISTLSSLVVDPGSW